MLLADWLRKLINQLMSLKSDPMIPISDILYIFNCCVVLAGRALLLHLVFESVNSLFIIRNYFKGPVYVISCDFQLKVQSTRLWSIRTHYDLIQSPRSERSDEFFDSSVLYQISTLEWLFLLMYVSLRFLNSIIFCRNSIEN